MLRTRRSRSLLCLGLASVIVAAALAAAEAPPATDDLRDQVTKREEALAEAREAEKKGAASVYQVDRAQRELAQVRAASALAAGDKPGAQAQLLRVVELERANLARMQQALRVGAVAAADLDAAERDLLVAQARLAEIENPEVATMQRLKVMVLYYTKRKDRMSELYKIGLESKANFDAAAKDLADAQTSLTTAVTALEKGRK